MSLKPFAIVSFVILLGAIGFALGFSRPIEAQAQRAQAERFQIVNGTPQLTANIMLLDTWTGASWELCADSTGTRSWCTLQRTNLQSGVDK